MSNAQCRWGILGTAAIARKNWKAIRLSGNGRVAAVASRSIDRARTFVKECKAEVPQIKPVLAVGSYQELIDHPDIDAVYIPLPTGIRKEWVIAAAEAGKHVLLEKPVAVNAIDAKAMIDACNAAGVQFMDGVMFDHSRRLSMICDEVKRESRLGKLVRIHTHFSFLSDDSFVKTNIRANHQLEPHGCVGDLGWYCIRFILWMAGFRLPHSVSARSLSSFRGNAAGASVPAEVSAELLFDDGLSASVYCSFLSANQQTATVTGSKGYLTIGDFVLPFLAGRTQFMTHTSEIDIQNCRWNFRDRSMLHSCDEYACGEENSQEVNMVRRLADSMLTGKVDPFYSDIALKTQQIVDAIRRSAIEEGAPVLLGDEKE